MTLVLTLASEHEVHMTCDFKLTNARTGKPLSVDAHKLVPIGLSTLQAVVGVTGLATLDGEKIGNWIAQRTTQLGFGATLDSLLESLREASDALERVPIDERRYRHLTFVIGAIQGSQSVIVLLSNYQNFRGQFIADGAIPGSDLLLDMIRPSGPRLVVAGQVRSVRKEERKALERLLRGGSPPDVIRGRMAEINKRAASRTEYVSEGCYAATELATGHGMTEPFLVEQVGDFLPPDAEDMLRKVGLSLTPKILPNGSRAPLQLRGATSASYSPSPQFFREQFKLRPADSELWNNFGAYETGKGRTDIGRNAYEKALEIDPDNYIAARNLGLLLWRVYGDRKAGRRWIDNALRNPDVNARRETLSLLAETLLFTDGNVSAARQYYDESMQGEGLSAPSARWAYFILHYEPSRSNAAEQILAELVAREPHYGLAVVGKAECLWRLHGDLSAARALVQGVLDKFPKDLLLISSELHLSLADGDLASAEKLLRQLTRQEGADSERVLGLGGLLCLCRGGPLRDAEDLFRQAGGRENAVNLSATLWAQGRKEECVRQLDSIDSGGLSSDAQVEVKILRHLAQTLPSGAAAEATTGDVVYQLGDPTLLRALSVHPEIAEEKRGQIRNFVDVIAAIGEAT